MRSESQPQVEPLFHSARPAQRKPGRPKGAKDPASLLSASEKAAWDKLGASYRTVRSQDQRGQSAQDIIDLNGSLLAWMRSYKATAIALRPDRFVAAADTSGLAVPDSADASFST